MTKPLSIEEKDRLCALFDKCMDLCGSCHRAEIEAAQAAVQEWLDSLPRKIAPSTEILVTNARIALDMPWTDRCKCGGAGTAKPH